MDGKVRLYHRPRSRFWQCAASLNGYDYRESTKEETLLLAKEFAMAWYMEKFSAERRRVRGGDELAEQPTSPYAGTGTPVHDRRRRTPKGPTFADVAATFIEEFELLTHGERNTKYVAQKDDSLRVHILPFLGAKPITEVTAGLVQDYRAHRMTSRTNKDGETKRPSRSTLHKEIVVIRQVLKQANRKGLISAIPDLSAPYRASAKVSRRAWFSPEEYKILYTATGERAKNPPKPRWKAECEKLHDYVLFMANTGLRPDEASQLQYRDVKIVRDMENGGGKILEIDIRGKRGVGYCKSMPGATLPFERLRKRMGEPKPTDLVWGKVQRELLNAVLEETKLKHDRDGQLRTAYSLRHTYISMRLMEGADIYQIAKNCRTSVEMVEKHYAFHIKNMLDTSAINVRKSKKPPQIRQKTAKAKAA